MATIASEPGSQDPSLKIYSHDGLHDSLTQLAAPTALYEQLRRELARANRERRIISIVRFVLTPTSSESSLDHPPSSSRYEKEILAFAQTLTRHSRDEEVCARVGELEFICIIHGVDSAVQRFIARIRENYRPDLTAPDGSTSEDSLLLHSFWLVARSSESALELLNRLDVSLDSPHVR